MSKVRVLVCVVTCAVAAASCGDVTAPPRPFVITLRVDSAAAPVIVDTPNGPQIVCNVRLVASASGNGTAQWQGGTSYWYTGAQRTTAVDSTAIASNDISATFGGDGAIAGGETRRASWYFVSAAPFDLSIDFAYRTAGGSSGTARTRLRCGPDPATAVPPAITSVTLSRTSGELRAGDTVSVSYRETSSSGVWVTYVAASGAFAARQVVGEHLATSVDRTVQFVVPPQSSLGVPLTITVQAYDAALGTRATSLPTQLVLAAQP